MENYIGSVRHQENARSASVLGREAALRKKAQRVLAYNEAPKVCARELCSTPIPYEKKRTNKFCSSTCSGFQNALGRDCSHAAEVREKIKAGVLGHSVKVGIRQCVNGSMVFQRQCKNCLKGFETDSRRMKTCSPGCAKALTVSSLDLEKSRTTGRRVIESLMAKGEWKGWSGRGKDQQSFPEKYVEQLLVDSGVAGFKKEFQVSRFSLDFAFVEKMIVLEVDGKQHEYPKQKGHDEKRDAYLQSQGWTVFRLK